ncbi:type II toxin-antitoxin system PemK/MazF family toxin [Agromyces archimandritae]|uniref:Type II toxin-antitoxin system PemK/MazF family toxin n=1 Tax=Agromyces archimandritae TaxID=2781962 RepID=A0A975FQ53_9MICO|nr:type II toxin-antitoxin system PemK/MazF family toxin [Agromyces archimandritae]
MFRRLASVFRPRADAGRAASSAPARREEPAPGQTGPGATVEVDPRRLRGVRVAYAPDDDETPDPGEVVWTWVPYEENDGRGKDRPVVILAASERDPGLFVAAQLTSRPHPGQADYVELGPGAWDAQGRSSWVDLGRVLLVRSEGMRREAASVDRRRYEAIAKAVRERYGW